MAKHLLGIAGRMERAVPKITKGGGDTSRGNGVFENAVLCAVGGVLGWIEYFSC